MEENSQSIKRKEMRVLVCGGRDYKEKDVLWNVLDNIGPPEITCIISGMAKGADTFAAEWAKRFGFKLEEYWADWKAHGKAAGPIRNQQMIDEGKPDLVIAFPGGNGTADMVRRAKKHNIEVKEISYPE